MKFILSTILTVSVGATVAMAQDVDPYMQAAIDSGVCGDAPVASAVYIAATNTIEATCEEDVTGFLPLAGTLAPVIAGGFTVLLASAGGGGSPSDTQ